MTKLTVYPADAEYVVKWEQSFAEGSARPSFIVVPSRNERDWEDFCARYLAPKHDSKRAGVIMDLSGEFAWSWLEQGLLENFTARVCDARVPWGMREGLPKWFPPQPGFWELVWGLLAVEKFTIDEPLRTMVDEEGYLVHDAYRILWEAWFLVKEHSPNMKPASDLIRTFIRWFTGKQLDALEVERLRRIGVRETIAENERYDLLCFLLVLASQNGLVDRIMFAFPGLERAKPEHAASLHQLYSLIRAVEGWTQYGPCPIGVLIGHTGDRNDLFALKAIHSRLADRVEQGLYWPLTK